MDKITIRVPIDLLEQMDDVVRRYNYKSVSDLVRRAIEELLESKRPDLGTMKIVLRVPEDMVHTMKRIMDAEGLYEDERDFIMQVVREYIKTRIKEIKKEYEELRNLDALIKSDRENRRETIRYTHLHE